MSKTLTIKDQTSAVVRRVGDRVLPAKGVNSPGVWKNYSEDHEQYDHHRSEKNKPRAEIVPRKGRQSGDKLLKFKAKREAVEDRIIRAIDAERKPKQAQPRNNNLTDAERKKRKERKRRQKARAKSAA